MYYYCLPNMVNSNNSSNFKELYLYNFYNLKL